MKKSRQIKKILVCFSLIFALCIAVAPKNVEAAAQYRYVNAGTLAPNTYTQVQEAAHDYNNGGDTYYAYKVNVPSDGYIKVYNPSGKWLHLLKRISKCYGHVIGDVDECEFDSYTRCIPVSKGTYYLCTSDYRDGTAFNLKYKFVKIAPTSNFCKVKASSLPSGKTKIICVNKRREFNRWYKIKLTSKKTITVTRKLADGSGLSGSDFEIFDSSGNCVDHSFLQDGKYRTARVPKGTYYIVVTGFMEEVYSPHRISTISWK